MGYYTLEFLYGRFEYLALAVLIVGFASILFVLKKHRLAGAICFLAPMPLYVYINFLSLCYRFATIGSMALALVSIAPFVVFAIFMLKKMKNILFIIPSALIFIPYIFIEIFDLFEFMHVVGGFPVNSSIHWLGFELSIPIILAVLAFIPLLIACLLGRKVKFLAYLPFAIYTTGTLFFLVMFTIDIIHVYIDYVIEATLPFMLLFSMALFCMAKQLASEKVPEKVQVKQIPAPQPVYTNYPPQNNVNTYRPQQSDMVQELAKYKNMLDQGLITEADYEQMKKRLLGI